MEGADRALEPGRGGVAADWPWDVRRLPQPQCPHLLGTGNLPQRVLVINKRGSFMWSTRRREHPDTS